MVLKAVFFEFSGVVIKDTALQQRLIDDTLVAENLRPDPVEFAEICIGRSARTCLSLSLTRRGRVPSAAELNALVARKSAAYIDALSQVARLPLYPGLTDFLYQLKSTSLSLVLVTGNARQEVEWVLQKAQLEKHFELIVTGETLPVEQDKPAATLYEAAIAQLSQAQGDPLLPADCLAVEASFAGITAAKQAGIPTVGVAHLYPYQMMQRRADWAVDYLNEIDLAWIQARDASRPIISR